MTITRKTQAQTNLAIPTNLSKSIDFMFKIYVILVFLLTVPSGAFAWGHKDDDGLVFVPDNSYEGGGGWWVTPEEALEMKYGGDLPPPSLKAIRRQLPVKWQGRVSGEGMTCLAAITCYWKIGSDVDFWTRRGMSSTGVNLTYGVVAVDPDIIPYGSLVEIEGIPYGFVAADCGSAVIKRVAVKKTAKTESQMKAVVVDVYFRTEEEGRRFDQSLGQFVKIKFFPPLPSPRPSLAQSRQTR
jgi:3D (Asp-Asp-Asp) domain-containing protein